MLVIFFIGMVGMWSIVQDSLYLQRAARDAAREAVLVGSDNPDRAHDVAKAVAADRAAQYFGSEAGRVTIDVDTRSIVGGRRATVILKYPRQITGDWGLTLNAKAAFALQAHDR